MAGPHCIVTNGLGIFVGGWLDLKKPIDRFLIPITVTAPVRQVPKLGKCCIGMIAKAAAAEADVDHALSITNSQLLLARMLVQLHDDRRHVILMILVIVEESVEGSCGKLRKLQIGEFGTQLRYTHVSGRSVPAPVELIKPLEPFAMLAFGVGLDQEIADFKDTPAFQLVDFIFDLFE